MNFAYRFISAWADNLVSCRAHDNLPIRRKGNRGGARERHLPQAGIANTIDGGRAAADADSGDMLRPSITRRTDFVPIAALRRRLDDLARQFRFDIKDDEDDLGPIRCAYLQTEEGNAFLLRRYRSYPEDFVDLFIPFPLRERPTSFWILSVNCT